MENSRNKCPKCQITFIAVFCCICSTLLLVSTFLVGLGFELKSLHLQSRYSTTLVIPPVYLFWLFWRWESYELFAQIGLKS
jgi:hypothetical protein